MHMDVRGKKVSVIGAGKSGFAVAELLCNNGAIVRLSELGSIALHDVERLQAIGITVEQGAHSELVYESEFAVISPGIPPHVAVVQELEQRAIPLYSEIEIASRFCKARIVGITGTDGKTTTTTLIHRLCEADGALHGYRAWSVGNIGVPFASVVQEMQEGDVAVVELSSYQLERCYTLRPNVAVITNITPDHLDRYQHDMQRYAAAKFRIYMNQQASDTLVYNADDALLREHFHIASDWLNGKLVPFSMEASLSVQQQPCMVLLDGDTVILRTQHGDEPIIKTAEFISSSFRGRHNIANVLATVAVAHALGIGNDVVRDVLRSFTGVEHRQELVATINGVEWINDSKATNINAMRQALETLPNNAVLLVGGRDKGNDYNVVCDLVQRKVTLLIALGESQEKIAAFFNGIVPVRQAASLEEAVHLASAHAHAGESVLFSPGCASFDMFANFEERGRSFKQLVSALSV